MQYTAKELARMVKGTVSLVASTVSTAFFCNVALADQYLSIMLSSQMFKIRKAPFKLE